MRGLANSHHKNKMGPAVEDISLLAVDIIGYITVSVLMGILFTNIFGAIV